MLEKEQKSVEYLDKDKVYAIMTKLTNLSYSTRIPINSDEYKKLNEITKDVRDLLDYPIEQKPAEWSEEDKTAFKYLHRLISFGFAEKFMDAQTAHDMREWLNTRLKSLRPQPNKWYIKKGHWYMCIVDKPEYGWIKGKVYQSPEDNRIETDYEGDLTNWPDSEPWFRPATRDEIPDSKPQWKPSKEQMEALNALNLHGGLSYVGQQNQLISLYQDLKELM